MGSKYHYYEHSMSGFNNETEAQQWIEDNANHLRSWIGEDWAVNETVKQNYNKSCWTAIVTAYKV